jgi:hypothetical protein
LIITWIGILHMPDIDAFSNENQVLLSLLGENPYQPGKTLGQAMGWKAGRCRCVQIPELISVEE